MKNNDQDFIELRGIYLLKKDNIKLFQQDPICKQTKNENKQIIDKPFDI
ncbi:MAG: hypothetical protein ACI8WT_001716, partial [Clostridium sp.]